MRRGCLLFIVLAIRLSAQRGTGELRLTVTDATGVGVEASIQLVNQAAQIKQNSSTNKGGEYTAKALPFGNYRLQVEKPGFATVQDMLEIRSQIPVERRVTLGIRPVETSITVQDADTLLDANRTAPVYFVGAETMRDRPTAQPGRGLLELVDAQPGWLMEANGVLHPRGSEYNVQYMVDGFPMAENRSPAFAPGIETEELESMNVFTGGYPAEYGRKLGGVVELNTVRNPRPGFHGRAMLQGGSFSTAGGFLGGQFARTHSVLSLSAEGARTDRYLDPPVEENYSNRGFSNAVRGAYDRDWGDRNRLRISLHHGRTSFLVPNERLQEQAGQRQDRRNSESVAQVSYQRVLSPNLLGDVRGMFRDLSADLWSNPLSTPILAGQRRGFRDAYGSASLSAHHGVHEMKVGGEFIGASVREQFDYLITDPGFFDPDVAPRFRFDNRRQSREASGFAQDLIRAGNWTLSAGVRWDYYSLLVREHTFSPRLGISYHLPSLGLVLRASYDRTFEVPPIENLLLASSVAAQHLTPVTTGLPVPPSRGHFYQVSAAKSIASRVRVEAVYFRRNILNFSDDDLLLNTGVSFPITFSRAHIHGIESKLEVPRWGPVSGFVSYSNLVGTGQLPVTGGLFLEASSTDLLTSKISFPITQDQRNTVRSRWRYQLHPRLWAAAGASYGSGLPIELDEKLSPGELLERFGPRIVSRVDFERGRVRPSFSADVSAGAEIYRHENRTIRLQFDCLNLTNRLNVINFAGLFSGTALAQPRTFAGRLTLDF
jgi:hypothetical protein